MLKKIISILLVPVVLVFSSGLTVFAEHCGMSKTPTYSLSAEQGCCCSKEVHAKCCHQTKIIIKKIEDSYARNAAAVIPPLDFHSLAATILLVETAYIQPVICSVYTSYHAPPDLGVPFPVLYRALLI